MGCGSSQSSQMGYRKQPKHRVVTYREHSEPSTSCSFLDQRSEPDGQEHDIANNADDGTKDLESRAHQKPPAEHWAEPPASSTSQPCAKQQATGKKATINKKGPQPTRPSHTVHDTRRPANCKACPCDQKHFMEPKPPG